MSYEEDNKQYRAITGTRAGFYCVVSNPSQKKRHIRAMGVDSYKNGVNVGSFAPLWHQFLYVTHGGLTIHFDGQSITATEGESLLMPAGVERMLTSTCDVGWLWFHMEDLPLYKGLKAKGILKKSCPEGSALMKLYQLLRQEPQGSILINSYIEILCEKMQRLLLSKKSRPYENEFNELWQKIQQAPNSTWSIDLVCKELKLSRAHLHKLCAAYFSAPPMDIITGIRLEHGAYLLTVTNKIIEDIAYDCGFSSARSFSKAFLNKYKKRPGKFRREC